MKKIYLISAMTLSVSIGLMVPSVMSAQETQAPTQQSTTQQKAAESQWLDPKQAEKYWNSEHFKNAKPLPLPMGPAENTQRQLEMQVPKNPEDTKLLQGSDFPAKWIRQPQILFDLNDTKSETSISQSILYDAGADTPKAPFSSARVNPLFAGQNWYFSADANSPFRRTGVLFFTIPGVGDAICTASIIQARILLTAGHCLHEGNGQQSGFHTNYSFVPAFRDNTAPYGIWHPVYQAVTSGWFNTGNQGYNAADFGVLVLNDQNGLRIGDALGGWYSFRTQGLVGNHVTMLGYPLNLDNAQKMHRVDAQFFGTIDPNNAVYGDDMQHGSSGGPWIENFGTRSIGQTGGIQPIHNVVVGVTSSGVGNPSAPSLLVTSSIPDNGVAQMILNACNVAPGTCQ